MAAERLPNGAQESLGVLRWMIGRKDLAWAATGRKYMPPGLLYHGERTAVADQQDLA